jgi:hypothetical protein
MHRSSETIGAIAAALAKAQAELSNPEKSLTATLPSQSRGERERTFQYAPLSSGLDIVRKCLGRHEIASLQTTAIDDKSGIIRLTTVLAHSSGEWVSSDWPVCPVTETAEPHRMGAALTYARRYALFTLVGIAGEDDLDAPKLGATAPKPSQDPGVSRRRANGGGQPVRPAEMPARRKKPSAPATDPHLNEAQSAQLRDTLVAEIERIGSGDEAAMWAQGKLNTKNTLMPADASAVEGAFARRLSSLEESQIDFSTARDGDRPNGSKPGEPGAAEAPLPLSDGESRPVLQKGIRLRDKEHRKFVASKPCLVCGRVPSDPHHLRFAQPRALGRRVSDEFTVPLCRLHHRELHRRGDEAAWWQANKIDPIPFALRLWHERQFEQSDI